MVLGVFITTRPVVIMMSITRMNPISFPSPISSPAIAFGINASDDNNPDDKKEELQSIFPLVST